MRDEHLVQEIISLNIASGLREHLRGRPCRVFMADMKVRVRAADVYYYPDVFVTCDSRDRESYFKERPYLVPVLKPVRIEKKGEIANLGLVF